jgi:hypothetical protein
VYFRGRTSGVTFGRPAGGGRREETVTIARIAIIRRVMSRSALVLLHSVTWRGGPALPPPAYRRAKTGISDGVSWLAASGLDRLAWGDPRGFRGVFHVDETGALAVRP